MLLSSARSICSYLRCFVCLSERRRCRVSCETHLDPSHTANTASVSPVSFRDVEEIITGNEHCRESYLRIAQRRESPSCLVSGALVHSLLFSEYGISPQHASGTINGFRRLPVIIPLLSDIAIVDVDNYMFDNYYYMHVYRKKKTCHYFNYRSHHRCRTER